MLELLHLALEELDVADGLVEHGGGVHLGAAGDEALQDADALADPLAPVPRRHALRVLADAHVAAPGLLDGGRVDVHRLHGGDPVHHLLHGAQLLLDVLGGAAAAAVLLPAAARLVLLLLPHLLLMLLSAAAGLLLLAELVVPVVAVGMGGGVEVKAEVVEPVVVVVVVRLWEQGGRRRRIQAGMVVVVVCRMRWRVVVCRMGGGEVEG